MNNFQGKKDKKMLPRILQSTVGLVFLSIVLVFFISTVISFVGKRAETAKNKNIAQEKVMQLQKRKEQLIYDIENLNTDTGKEKIFRENFGLALEGENLIVVVDEKKTPETPSEDTQKGFFDFFKNMFSN